MTHLATSRRRRPRGGFTIVELLATLTLVCIVLPVAVHGIVLCLETASHSRQQAEATALAQSKLAELVATGQWYDAQSEGDFGDDWPQYQWAAWVYTWEDSRLSELDVRVAWSRRGKDYGVLLSTLVYTGSTATTETTGTTGTTGASGAGGAAPTTGMTGASGAGRTTGMSP